MKRSRLQNICNWLVAYLVPGPVWRAWARFPYWHRWYWRNLRDWRDRS